MKYIRKEKIHSTTVAGFALPYLISALKPDGIIDMTYGKGSWLSIAKYGRRYYIKGVACRLNPVLLRNSC